MSAKLYALAIGIGFFLIVGIAVGFAAFEPVDEGEVKVVKDRGAVTGEVFDPGYHFRTPLIESTEAIPTRPQTYTMSGDPHEGDVDDVDSIEFMSSDQQQVNADVTVRYEVPAEAAPQFHSDWNTLSQAEDRLIRPVTQSVVQERGSAMDATEANSDEGRTVLAEEIKEELEDQTGAEVSVQDVQVRDIHFDPTYREELENIEIEEAQAEQRVIEAEGEAEAEITEAEGTAEAYEIRDEVLTEDVLMEAYINAIDESDQVIMATGEDGTPVILDAGDADDSSEFEEMDEDWEDE